MRVPVLATWLMSTAIGIAGLLFPAAESTAQVLENETCIGCHGNEGFSADGADGKPRNLHVIPDKFGKSVHGKRLCVECHKNITAIPHEPGTRVRVSCVECHESQWKSAQLENRAKESERMGVVVQQIDRYMKSIHARPSREDQSRTNATCYNCHDAHYVYPKGSDARKEWRLEIPNACGKCHAKERELYATSVHGKLVLEKRIPVAAICSDCHTTHDVEDPSRDSTRLVIIKNCGNCHADSLKTYTGTYHGQVSTLGYAHTAKCFDCHGSHVIQRVEDAKSSVHPDNRLKTCQKCHQDATAGFVTFLPHGNTQDLDRYPTMWAASKFMIGLLLGTFAFFWTHGALWFYREYKERQERKNRQQVRADELPHSQGKHFQRFGILWRLAHLFFAVSLMMLTAKNR